ncbi:MAG: replication initiator protein [Microviridae sp.]|nr:MAG: replication initiator protein [Microviridae sp.]
MPCFGPLTAYRPKAGASSRKLVFRLDKSEDGLRVMVPCGRCTGCRLERSRQWAMRCMHEVRMHNMSSFVTLTYNDEWLPEGNTLVLPDLQKFMKRLRKVTGDGLRFYACGEYGDSNGRPHYHVLLLNYDFDDRRYYRLAKRGERLFTSATLDGLWSSDGRNMGLAVVGDVSFDSCAYVARYIMKKRLGGRDFKIDPETGVVLLPEFTVMSRNPGLGTGYVEKYGNEVLAFDSVVVNGREVRPPRFYDTKLDGIDPVRMDAIRCERKARVVPSEGTSRRLRAKEEFLEAALKSKSREL